MTYNVNFSFINCNVFLKNKSLFDGKYDENFKVECSGLITIKYKDVLLREWTFIEVKVDDLRIWYLYRKLNKGYKEYSKELEKDICNCLSHNKSYMICTKNSILKFISRINSEFDEKVECSYKEICLKHNKTEPISKCSKCSYWKEGCKFEGNYTFKTHEYNLLSSPSKVCLTCPEQRISFIYLITCIDKKYKIPIGSLFKYLKVNSKIYYSKRSSYLNHPCCGCNINSCCSIQ